MLKYKKSGKSKKKIKKSVFKEMKLFPFEIPMMKIFKTVTVTDWSGSGVLSTFGAENCWNDTDSGKNKIYH